MDCKSTSNFLKNEGKQHQKERFKFWRPKKTGDKSSVTLCNISYCELSFHLLN